MSTIDPTARRKLAAELRQTADIKFMCPPLLVAAADAIEWLLEERERLRTALQSWYNWCQKEPGADPLKMVIEDGKCMICYWPEDFEGIDHQEDCEVLLTVQALSPPTAANAKEET